MEERLQKLIAEAGYASRRKAEELITKGKVSVNGEIVRELGTKATRKDEIVVEGQVLSFDEEKEYYLLNKPRETVSTVSDDKGRKTVVELIETDKRIFPIGRLDYDTTGLLLLTNDGELTNILTHPNSRVPKVYLAKLDRELTMEDYHAIKEGVKVDGRVVNVSHLKIKKKNREKGTCFVELTIHEGRNHIVRRLFETLSYDVIKLTRTGYGPLSIGTLLSGEYRTLSRKEVAELYRYKR